MVTPAFAGAELVATTGAAVDELAWLVDAVVEATGEAVLALLATVADDAVEAAAVVDDVVAVAAVVAGAAVDDVVMVGAEDEAREAGLADDVGAADEGCAAALEVVTPTVVVPPQAASRPSAARAPPARQARPRTARRDSVGAQRDDMVLTFLQNLPPVEGWSKRLGGRQGLLLAARQTAGSVGYCLAVVNTARLCCLPSRGGYGWSTIRAWRPQRSAAGEREEAPDAGRYRTSTAVTGHFAPNSDIDGAAGVQAALDAVRRCA